MYSTVVLTVNLSKIHGDDVHSDDRGFDPLLIGSGGISMACLENASYKTSVVVMAKYSALSNAFGG